MNLHNLTVCDQIRQEVNGKFLLVGVYTNGIILPQLPTSFFLSLWMLIETNQLGANAFKIRVRMPEINVDLIEFEGEIDVRETNDWTPVAMGNNILIGQPGTMTIEAKLGNEEEWSVIRSINIRRGPVQPLM